MTTTDAAPSVSNDNLITTKTNNNNNKIETIYDACRLGNESRVSDYIAKGGCLTERDHNNMTLLHHAAFSANPRVLELLLLANTNTNNNINNTNNNINMEARDCGGWTPLHYAAARGHTTSVAALLEAGAAPGARDDMGRTPLHLAAAAGYIKVINLLLNNGAPRQARNVVGLTPLEVARAGNQVEVINILEKK